MGANKTDRGMALAVAREREAARRHTPAYLMHTGRKAFGRCSCGHVGELDLLALSLAGKAAVDLRMVKLACPRPAGCKGERPALEIVPHLGAPHTWR